MNIFERIISFFKKLFNKEKSIKMIDAPVENLKKGEKTNFINSLKVNIKQHRTKKKIETLTCYGDGLGIQNKIEY